jgi:predicted enzyme related to lactoylglutathione lyase
LERRAVEELPGSDRGVVDRVIVASEPLDRGIRHGRHRPAHGGLMKNPMPGAPSMWVPYVLVDDLAAASSKARSLGATVMKDATEVTGAGSFVIITDPTGGMLGLWESRKA